MTPDPVLVRKYEEQYLRLRRREERRQWLFARLDLFVTACVQALGYCAVLALLVWAAHHGLL